MNQSLLTKKKSNIQKAILCKAEGNALLYSLFVLLIVSLICSSLILYAYLNNKSLLNLYHKEDVIKDVDSGITLLLDDDFMKVGESNENYSLYSIEGDQVKLSKESWGLFKILKSEKSWRNYTHRKIALVGDFIKQEKKTALYLADKKKPLSMSGRAVLKGKSYLPKAGIKTSIIEGKRFMGEMPHPNQVLTSEETLPLNQKIFEGLSFDEMKNKYLNPKSNLVNPKIEKGELINSFGELTKVLYYENAVSLSKVRFKGKIVIISEKSISINNSVIFDDVVFIAPKITINKKVEGRGQFFARDTLAVFEDVNLHYPSSLCVINKNKDASCPFLFIDEDANIEGVVINYAQTTTEEKKPLIRMLEDAQIKGQLIVNGNFEFKGDISGSVYCNNFFLKTPVSIYENHLYDASIDLTALPEVFVGIDFINESSINKVVKWLE